MNAQELLTAANGTFTLNDTDVWTGEAIGMMVNKDTVFTTLHVDNVDAKATLLSDGAGTVSPCAIRPRGERLITDVTLASGQVTLILK